MALLSQILYAAHYLIRDAKHVDILLHLMKQFTNRSVRMQRFSYRFQYSENL